MIAIDVPDRYGGTVARLGFHPMRQAPSRWYRYFDPRRHPDARARARQCLQRLNELAIAHRWEPKARSQVIVANQEHQLGQPKARGLSHKAQRVEDQQFQQYQREMARALYAPSAPLPTPIGAQGIDRRPGLSKSGPKKRI